ncbi:SDR family NAD(P)-dependent oxidoreductase [Geodermatophilus sp. SYSU D00703]
MAGQPGSGRDGGSTAVVTGGARGIGRALAERLSADGHRVTVLDVAAPEDGATTDSLACAVTEPDQPATAMATVAERAGGIDVLVDNAGLISPRRPYPESGKDQLLRHLTVNAVGCAPATEAAHPWLVTSDRTMAQQAIRRRVRPEDLVGLVSFLCGPDARMVTGQTGICDGGGYLH